MLTFLRRESLWIPIILLVTLVGCWIELDLYAPSFPQMMHHFSTSEQMMQWTLSLNFLGFFFASLLCGPMADAFGRRKIFLSGSLIFVVGSALCLMAPSMTLMLIGRLIQGIGVSAPVTVCMAIIADIYQGERQIRLLSRMNSSVTVTMALAPIAGVFLTDNFGWQANFMLILVLAMMGLMLMLLFVPETHAKHLRTEFNAKNLLAGYTTLLKSRDFMANVLALCLSITPYFILIGILPLLFMEALKVSIHEYAFYQGSIVGLFSILSLGIPSIIAKYDQKKVFVISTALSVGALGLTFLLSVCVPDNPLLITCLMWIYVCGIVVPPTMMFTRAMDMFPALRACASSLIQSIRMLSMSLGTALAGSLYQGQLRPVAFIMFLFMLVAIPLIVMAMKKEKTNETLSTNRPVPVLH
jgi:MFS transporter, DHA1 family, multidrug resistance protein